MSTLRLQSISYSSRSNYVLSLPSPKSTTYGLHSLSYMASKLWNSLPDSFSTSDFSDFKRQTLQYDFLIVKILESCNLIF